MSNYLPTRIKLFLNNIIGKLGFQVSRIGPYSFFNFESFLYRHLANYKTLTFLQIGANDGMMNDPIYKFNLKNKSLVFGYVLEPLPDIFLKLVNNYKSCANIKAFNFAIHASEAEMVLHRVKPSLESQIPEFARGIASFDSTHWEKTTLVPNVDYMEQVIVKCVSFDSFVKSNSIEKLDLLLLDTEGYDYQILMSIDFTLIRPKIIRFEHGVRNNIMSASSFVSICNHLNSFGYQIIAESYDATAYLLDPIDLAF